jgi:hypothetical protein
VEMISIPRGYPVRLLSHPAKFKVPRRWMIVGPLWWCNKLGYGYSDETFQKFILDLLRWFDQAELGRSMESSCKIGLWWFIWAFPANYIEL